MHLEIGLFIEKVNYNFGLQNPNLDELRRTLRYPILFGFAF